MIKNNEEEQHIVKETIKFMPINEQYAEDLKLVWSDEEVIKYPKSRKIYTQNLSG